MAGGDDEGGGADWRQEEEVAERMHFHRASREAYFAFVRRRNPALFDRFIAKVDVLDALSCWPWRGARTVGGYGWISIAARRVGAHRVAHWFFRGEASGLEVRHQCHNPGCVNPGHLLAGTHFENMRDREAAGRGGDHRGIKNGRAVLSDDDVRAIRASSESGAVVARRLGVSRVTVCGIRRGVKWRHVK